METNPYDGKIEGKLNDLNIKDQRGKPNTKCFSRPIHNMQQQGSNKMAKTLYTATAIKNCQNII